MHNHQRSSPSHYVRTPGGRRPVLGLSLFTRRFEFMRALDVGARRAASRLGIELVVVDGDHSSQQQLEQIEQLLADGISALLLSPNHSLDLVPGVLAANRAAVPVVTVDGIAGGGLVAAHIGLNNAMAAAIAAKHLARHLPGGEWSLLELQGAHGSFHAQQRAVGFQREMRKHTRLHVISERDEWMPERAYETTLRGLRSQPPLAGVFAHTDHMLIGVVAALDESARLGGLSQPRVLLAGIDATPSALDRIRHGRQHLSVQQNPYIMGRTAVHNAVAIIQGHAYARLVQQRPLLVTRENVDARYLWANRTGFSALEDWPAGCASGGASEVRASSDTAS